MDSNFYSDTYSYREGRILIYKRPNSNNFQCRLRIEGIRGYIIQSCKTSNLGNAVKFAEDTYDNLRFKKLNNLPLKSKTFTQIYNDWFAKADKSEYRQDFYQSRAKLYLKPYFGDYDIKDITEDVIDGYWRWRKNYYKDNPEKLKGNATDTPSQQSLKMEKTAIKEVLEYAFRKGYIRSIPKINFKAKAKTENRDTFTKEEFTSLVSYLIYWSDFSSKASDKYQRKMIYNLVKFLAFTGIRPSEYYKIKWKDITIQTKNDIKLLYIYIPDNTKTGQRTVVSLPEAYSCYTNIKSFSKYTEDNNLFFTNYDGSSMKNFSKTYIKVLKDLNLYISRNGKKRPPYSLRHYYATQRLLNGVQVYDLAKNMGTSVDKIEKHYGHILSVQKTAELIQGAPKSSLQNMEELEKIFNDTTLSQGKDPILERQKVKQEVEDILKQVKNLKR